MAAIPLLSFAPLRPDDAGPPFRFSHGTVVAGHELTVELSASDCLPVTVTVFIGGEVISIGDLRENGDRVTLDVPRTAAGKSYLILLECGDDVATSDGQVL